MPGITKADVDDLDFVDADEASADGTVSYLTIASVSTTTGTGVVVVALAPDGEGIQTSRDHPVEVGDKAVITGTSGGLGDGTFTVASIIDDTTFVVVEAIGTSTGGSVAFYYLPGATRIGFSPVGQTITTANNLQQALTDVANAIVAASDDLFLDAEPTKPDNTYANTKVNGRVTQEAWRRTSDSTLIKTIDYTYTSGKVTTEVRKVYASNGITVTKQMTLTYTYSGSSVLGIVTTRDI